MQLRRFRRLALSFVLLIAPGCEGAVSIIADQASSIQNDAGPAPDVGPRPDGGGGPVGYDSGGPRVDTGPTGICPLPPTGSCQGTTLSYCDGAAVRTRDCAAEDKVCGLENGQYACIEDDMVVPNDGCADPIELEVIANANSARAAQGLDPLTCDPLMTISARKHSVDMCENGYFSHSSRDGRSPFDRMREEGVRFGAAGENIAAGQRSADQVHSAWMGSSGHRANILGSRYRRIGVGYESCGGRPYWTQNFAD